MLKIDLVICTRNRTETVLNQIKLLRSLHSASAVRVLVVDNSDLTEKEFLVFSKRMMINLQYFRELVLVTSPPGLIFARNSAIKNLTGDIVIFIDDDVRLPLNFFPQMLEIFTESSEVIGVSPLIEGLFDHMSFFQQKFLKIFKGVQGRILPSAHSFWVDENSVKAQNVDWLPGCCMAYRTSKIKGIKFSEALLTGAAGGYSLGEDVDFSSRVSKIGRIICSPKIKIYHDLSPINRSTRSDLQRAIGEWRAYAASRISKVDYSLTISFEIMYLLSAFFLGPERLKAAISRWNGFISNPLSKGHIKSNEGFNEY